MILNCLTIFSVWYGSRGKHTESKAFIAKPKESLSLIEHQSIKFISEIRNVMNWKRTYLETSNYLKMCLAFEHIPAHWHSCWISSKISTRPRISNLANDSWKPNHSDPRFSESRSIVFQFLISNARAISDYIPIFFWQPVRPTRYCNFDIVENALGIVGNKFVFDFRIKTDAHRGAGNIGCWRYKN